MVTGSKYIGLIAIMLASRVILGQGYVTYVYDAKNIGAETVNQGVRLVADNNLIRMLESVKENKRKALENLTIVEQIHKRVFQSLTTVNQTIRQGKAVLEARAIITDILQYQQQAAQLAAQDPVLALFAEKQEAEFKDRGYLLLLYIKDFILAEKEELLMDVGKRDKLLDHVITELRVMRALAYSANRHMYWARYDGIFRSLNPWQSYLDQDLKKGKELLRNFKF